MEWHSLEKKCDLCKLQGPSVIDINHGDKKIFMCSYEWNNWLEVVLGDDPDGTLATHLVLPEACEDPTSPAQEQLRSPSQ
jgi:hypothetical protein